MLFHAFKLNLFDKLGEKPSTAEEIAAMCGAQPGLVHRVLRALAAMKLLVRDGSKYFCTEKILDSTVPGREKNLSHFCRLMGEDFSSGIWVDIPLKTVNRNLIQPPPVNEEPMRPKLFTLAMHNIALQGELEAITGRLDLSGKKNLLDFGGGSGIYSIAFCRKYPQLTALIIELPEVVSVPRNVIAEHELDERIGVLERNWNEVSFSGEFDVVLLSDVLYSSEEECRQLIDIAFQALEEGGIAAVRGYFLDEGDDRIFPALFNINLMLHSNDQASPEVNRVEDWLKEAGFMEIESSPLTEMSYLITAVKPHVEDNK